MTITPAQIDQLLRHGYAIIPSFLSAAELSAARENLLQYFPTAQELMATTAKSLAEISHEVGFCDQSYFGQVFRKLLKTTPRDYRLRLEVEGAEPSFRKK